jgi:hypothetical protein
MHATVAALAQLTAAVFVAAGALLVLAMTGHPITATTAAARPLRSPAATWLRRLHRDPTAGPRLTWLLSGHPTGAWWRLSDDLPSTTVPVRVPPLRPPQSGWPWSPDMPRRQGDSPVRRGGGHLAEG